eukprot:5353716-Prymnesium_polylepis.1
MTVRVRSGGGCASAKIGKQTLGATRQRPHCRFDGCRVATMGAQLPGVQPDRITDVIGVPSAHAPRRP